MISNQKGQNAIEHLLLFSAVVMILLIAFFPKSQQSIVVNGVEKTIYEQGHAHEAINKSLEVMVEMIEDLPNTIPDYE
jgi:uncharacterized protein (UPF0333 family)